ncbi:MAG: hypothetical protein NZ610_04375 [Candidatus Bipolaricaulota bacterium]|nr:hypothetical protein [Candidatus Bipolaricaulota bacterium]MCS7274626.1 hypothetical protein [Candidatus Bipolaricaulota bacterium]MDW8110944.1 hypothetical protein [Candidatus Bipolaricaulota bacterium]MDW8329096.1 hypothetical protein [Candidatus Bipolaricaulota bacterium]
MKNCVRALIVLMGFAMAMPVAAQNLTPVFEQNSVDGYLLGAQGSFKLFQFLEPSLALAYGLQSQKIRYQAGLTVWEVKLSLLDWPGTPVLGRVGQSGLQVTHKSSRSLGTLLDVEIQQYENSVTLFFGTLWPWVPNELPPDILYLSLSSAQRFALPFGITLNVNSRTLYGWWRLGVLPLSFQYTQSHLELKRDLLSVSFGFGTLQNEGRLPDFEFVQSVKGETETIKGEQFWALRFERRFEMIRVPLGLPPLPVINKPLFESFFIEGAVFVQLSTTKTALREKPEETEEAERCARCIVPMANLLSWGLSAILSLDGLKFRLDIVFKRDGEYRLLFGS